MKWSIPSRLIEEGRQLVDDEAIKRLIPDVKAQQWYAEVFDGQWRYVRLDGTAKEEDRCQCENWQQKGYCKHTVGVELFLRSHQVSRQLSPETKNPFYYPKMLGDDRIDAASLYRSYGARYRSENEGEETPEKITPLAIKISIEEKATEDAFLSDNQEFIAHLWIKDNHWYEISDWEAFLKALVHGDAYALTRHGDKHVWLSKEAFDADAYQLLSDLAEIMSHSSLPETRGGQVLTPVLLERLTASDKEGEVLTDWYLNDQNIELTVHEKSERPMIYEITQLSNQRWRIQMKDNVHFYRRYRAIVDGTDWYPIDAHDGYFDAIRMLNEFFSLHHNRLEMAQEDFFKFMSYFGLVMMSHTLIKNIVSVPLVEPIAALVVEASVDIVDNNLLVSLTYHYDENIIAHGQESDSLEKVLLRDIDGEMGAQAFLMKDGFKEKDHKFYKSYSSLKKCLIGLEQFLNITPNEWQLHYSERLSQLENLTLKAEIQTQSHLSNRYLNITFDVEGVSDKDVERILEAIEKEQNYLSLSNNRIIDVQQLTTPDQRKLLKNLQDEEENWKNGGSILTYKAFGYAETLGQSETFKTFYNDITHFASEEYKAPSELHATLADFQKYAVQWLMMLSRYSLGGILADEMGLGKTIQTITFLLEYRKQQPEAQILILAPASLLYNWKHEIERFAPSLEAFIIDGSQKEREEMRKAHAGAVWIASYQSFRNDREAYHHLPLDILIMDEAQALKNSNTILYQSVSTQPTRLRIGLCGTPLENNLQEFWALMQVVLPGLFPDARTYSQMDIDEIRYMSNPFVLRRTKAEVALQLPEKEQHDRYLSLNNEQKTLYLAYLEDIKQRISQSESNDEQAISHVEILSAITRLRQICCHPKLIDTEYSGESAKFEYLKSWLSEVLTNDNHILIFSQFTKMLDVIADYLDANGIHYFKITGATKKASRQRQVDAFNHGERPIFLISLRAGGVGLNLTGADTVLLYDLWWNPSVEEQAIGRAHRIGQERDVTVYRFITEGTIEERISELQEEKRQLFDQLLGQSDNSKVTQLSMDDLKFILGIKN